MSDSVRRETPKTKPATAGGPPGPPKKTAKGLGDQAPEEPHIHFPDPVPLKLLAAALGRKRFQIIADVMELGQFKSVHDTLTFDSAARIARKYGLHAARAT